jgi:tetratricopeptide (TPR) repeat protein
VPGENARIHDLRRRVQADPTSIAFAQLAEELRRSGVFDEAAAVCRTGLARHPGYLSARVTLGRALIELDQLDEAHEALAMVVAAAPDNLAAIRGLAEIHQRRGEITEALEYYRRALELARHDPELEETVERMRKEVAPHPPAEPDVSIEALFDFDRLVQQLGADTVAPTPAPVTMTHLRDPLEYAPKPESSVPLPAAEDAFAELEASLRSRDADRRILREVDQTPRATEDSASDLAVLEDWLDAIRLHRS